MYQYLFPIAQKNLVRKISLEVIRENEKAYAVYLKNGFKKHRELICFSGQIPKEKKQPPAIEIRKLEFFPTIDYTWWNSLPTWPAASASLAQIEKDLLMAGAFFENKMAGYLLALKSTGRIFQLCVNPEHRRKGIAGLLLHECIDPKTYPSVLALNVDAGDKETCNFFRSIGWKESVIQFELIKELD
jgi:ribosomal protein S18 acetylase RimI-like enzyme